MKWFTSIAVAALAAVIGLTSVAFADVTVYGRVTAGAQHVDNDKENDDGAWNLGAVGQGSNSTDNAGRFNGTRFGFKGEQDLGNGLSAGFQIEREVREKHTPNTTRQRHNLVWLSGGWGKLTMGFQGNPYMKARNWDQTYLFGGNWHESYRLEGINYSMSNGPFSLNIMALGQVESDENDSITIAGIDNSANNDLDDVDAGSGKSSGSDGIDGWVIHAGYDFGIAAVNVAHHADNKDYDITEPAEGPAAATSGAPADAARALATNVNNGAVDANASRDRTAIGFNGSVGAMNWYLAYQTTELNAGGNGFEDNDNTAFGGIVSFDMSERDTVYAYYVSHSGDRSRYNATGGETLGEDYTETIVGYTRDMGPGVRFIAEYVSHDLDLEADNAGSDPSKLGLAIRYVF